MDRRAWGGYSLWGHKESNTTEGLNNNANKSMGLEQSSLGSNPSPVTHQLVALDKLLNIFVLYFLQ